MGSRIVFLLAAGSRYFVRHPPFPLEHVVLNANMEMIGTPDSLRYRDRFSVTGRLTEEMRDLVDSVKRRHGRVTFDYSFRVEGRDSRFRRADHVNFFLRGIPTLYFYGGNDANYHRPSDDIGAVDMHKVGTMAELLVALLEVGETLEALPRPEANRGG